MSSGTLRGIFTAVLLIAFIGVCVWAWSSRRRATFEKTARLPLEEDATAKPGKDGKP